MSFIDRCVQKIAQQAELNASELKLMRYGFRVLYINIGKTLLLFICAAIIGILKETAVLFCAFGCVRLSGFGVHSDSTIKCTFIGLTGFIGGTCLAICIAPLSVAISVPLCCICIVVFALYAPVETNRHPISEQHKKMFKKVIIITATPLFIISLLIGETVYRNLIIIGVLQEAIIMLPPVRKIIK